MSEVTILLVDDHDATRHEMVSLIEEENFQVIGEASTGEEGVQLAKDLHPGLVIMDIVMPGISGIDAARRILSFDSSTKVLVLSNHSGSMIAKAVLQSGAMGFVRKDYAYEELLPAIKAVIRDEEYIGTRVKE